MECVLDKKEISNKVVGALLVAVIVMLITLIIVVSRLDPVSIEKVALDSALENFFYIREEDEAYAYTVTKLDVGNVPVEKGQMYNLYEIMIMDERGDKEMFFVGVWYKRHFLYADGEITMRSNIIYVKVNEI